MIRLPPGDPMARTGRPSCITMVGAIEERGRLPGSSRLAMGTPLTCVLNEKSVSSLFNRNPPAISRDPKAFSIVLVIDRTLPAPSTIEICVVEGSSIERSSAQRPA